jgi:hypothetical protein
MFGYFYSHIYLKITAKPQIPFLKEMVFVNELFFWLKKKVKKIRKIESNLTPHAYPILRIGWPAMALFNQSRGFSAN